MCAIAGVYVLKNKTSSVEAASMVNRLLARLQNRGDLSTGMTRYHPEAFNILEMKKGRGTVREYFGEQGSHKNRKMLESLSGLAVIGHNRYATSGQTSDEEAINHFAQPYLREHNRRWKEFSFCFNGNICNVDELMKKILKKDGNYYFKTDTDTELIKIFLSLEFNRLRKPSTVDDFLRIFRRMSRSFDGAYNIVFIDGNGNFLAVRDPNGFHPLFYSLSDGYLIVSSEDSAIRGLGMDHVHEVPPGFLVWSNGNEVREIQYAQSPRKAHCIFEFVYFMNAASTFAGRLVQKARGALGNELGENETFDLPENTVTAPVPGTAIGMCDGYQHGFYHKTRRFLPRYDALVKVSESRSFISDFGYHTRHQVIRNKFDLTPGYLEGKELVLVDDSIVRGSTSKQLIAYVREQTQAQKVHMRIAAAPNRFPCFYGINMPTQEELIAHCHDSVDGVRKAIGADTLVYNTVDQMVRAVAGSTGLSKQDFCLGCFTGKYPTRGANRCLSCLRRQTAAAQKKSKAMQKAKSRSHRSK